MSAEVATTESFIDQIRQDAPQLPGQDLAWVRDLRTAGEKAYADAGLPSRRTEAWKYTDVQRLARSGLTAIGASGDLSAKEISRIDGLTGDAPRAVFVDGRLHAELSRLPQAAGVSAAGLADLLSSEGGAVIGRLGNVLPSEDRPFVQINQAMMGDGLVLTVGRGAQLPEPLHLVFATTHAAAERAIHPRCLVVLEPQAEATLVEHHLSPVGQTQWVNAVTEIVVGDAARLNHYKWQGEGDQAFHYASVLATLGRDSRYEQFILTTGSRQARSEVLARMTGPGAELILSGGYLGRDEQHLDTTTRIEHAAPDCSSREVYKGVLDGKARGVFQGKILVDQIAQRTDGHQMTRALLLSDKAEADAKPELEIYADDVRCSHGATVGEIDHEQLFYLRSRGIALNTARRLLVEAFVADALEDISNDDVREQFAGHIAEWLGA